MEGYMSRLVVFAVGCLAALVIVATATATQLRTGTIEPWERVRGTLVVQHTPERADMALFGYYCEPDISTSAVVRRTCRDVPRTKRLFVGYGMWDSKTAIAKAWNKSEWSMWIDGQPVSLDRFGTTDRTLYKYPAAGGKDVTLREWSVVLSQPSPGRHTIRYRFRLPPQGVVDATWTFRVQG
jgi:hypothetical protein